MELTRIKLFRPDQSLFSRRPSSCSESSTHPGEILFDPACGTGGFLTCSLRHMRDRYVKKPEHEKAMQAAFRAVEKKQLPHMLCVTNMLLHGIEAPSFVRHDNTLARPYISYT